MGWFTPVRALAAAAPQLAIGPWEAFWILFYGAATYLHAGVLREKICQHACPYGRFQGSMLEPATRVVAYDIVRGEPRGARARGSDARALGQGDCVDCTLCVQVCPVGIDIRHGMQAECISCGLCIDACNDVMDKMKAPRGLVRFAALSSAATVPAHRRLRVWIYAAGLLAVGTAVVAGFATRPELRLNVLRDRSVLSRQLPDGGVENLYRLQVMNASLRARQLRVQAYQEGPGTVPLHAMQSKVLAVEPAGTATAVIALRMDAQEAQRHDPSLPLPIVVQVTDPDDPSAAKAQSDSTFFVR